MAWARPGYVGPILQGRLGQLWNSTPRIRNLHKLPLHIRHRHILYLHIEACVSVALIHRRY